VFHQLIADYLELESIMDAPLAYRYPAEYASGDLDEATAEGVALQERTRLKLGDGPIDNLRDLLEQEVGLRIFHLPLASSKYGAIYVYDDVIGACICVNSNIKTLERQRWSLVHDYSHFLVARQAPIVSAQDSYQR
jgi:Zn-dependent peptidase ImmA (M78 family)